MSVRFVCGLAFMAFVGAAMCAWAQDYSGGGYFPPYGGGYGGYGGGHASTAEEGIARGMADVMRSQGQRNLLNSAAAKNYEQARSQNLDNRLKATNRYFEMKERNKQYREENSRPRPTSEQLFRIAKEKAPDPLSPSELDPLTGQIAWPNLLMAEKYQPYREKFQTIIDGLVQGLGSTSGSGYQDIKQTEDEFLSVLREDIKQYSPNDYIASVKFIQSLAYDAIKM